MKLDLSKTVPVRVRPATTTERLLESGDFGPRTCLRCGYEGPHKPAFANENGESTAVRCTQCSYCWKPSIQGQMRASRRPVRDSEEED